MSYQIAPMADPAGEQSHAYWTGAFTKEELDRIVQEGEWMQQSKGVVDGTKFKPEIRKSNVSWFDPANPANLWLADRMAGVLRSINARFFGFDIWGFGENFQFTTYQGSEEPDHYTWHQDKGGSFQTAGIPRKLSMVLMLTDPGEYEGGDLEIDIGQKQTLSRERGIIHVFPSWVMHRVTPVRKGKRQTLVIWAGGPKFK